MTDARQHRNYGALRRRDRRARCVVTRILDFLFFDVAFRLRRGTAAPALLRQLVGLLDLRRLRSRALFKVDPPRRASAPCSTTSAIITAVIGLALQETLGNLFSGLALAIGADRPGRRHGPRRRDDRPGRAALLAGDQGAHDGGQPLLIPNSVASRDRLEVFRRGGPPMARDPARRPRVRRCRRPARAAALEAALRDVPGSRPASGAARPARHDLRRLRGRLRAALLARGLRALPRRRLRACASASGTRSSGRARLSRTRSSASTSTPPDRCPGPTGPGPIAAAIDGERRSSRRCPRPSAPRLAAGSARRCRYSAGRDDRARGRARRSSMFLIASGRAAVSVRGAVGESQQARRPRRRAPPSARSAS